MTALATTQRQFMNWLLSHQDDLAALIDKNGKLARHEKMTIYAEAYQLRLIEALQDSFPALHTLLGDDRFDGLARDYILQYPSQHFSIRYFGRRLAEFLHGNDRDPQSDLLSEMAGFEWALRHAFDAADEKSVNPDILQQIQPTQWPVLRFRLQPSLQLLDLQWNVPVLWQAIEDGADAIAPEQHEFPIRWVIWRHELITHYRSLEVDEAWTLEAAIEGNTFGGICEGICEWLEPEHAAPRAAGFLARWIEEGMLCALET